MNTKELYIGRLKEKKTPALDKDYKIRLTSTRLESGKCQVKFYATLYQKHQLYGYVLVDAEEKLKQVIYRIKSRLDLIRPRDSVRHSHLFSIGNPYHCDNNFLIFDK